MPSAPDPAGLVRRFGVNSLSYSTLAPGLSIFFPKDNKGFIAYRRVGGSMIALSDPICAEEDALPCIQGFREMARAERSRPVFFAATGRLHGAFQAAGFSRSKVASDSVLDISSFSLDGRAMTNVRRGHNRAVNAGIEVREYSPGTGRDKGLEDECSRISEEWHSAKRGPRLEFILGSLDWSWTAGKRYFLAMSKERVEGFLVYNPVGSSDWYLDMSQRRGDAPNGTTDYLVVRSMEHLRGDGAERLYLGMVPHLDFARDSTDMGGMTRRVLQLFADRFESFYPVSSERFFKEKYGPRWQDLYLYADSRITLGLMHDIFKAFVPRGLAGALLGA